MSARSLSVAVTAIAAAMVLTACGGGDSKPKDDKINGAEEGAGKPSEAASTSHPRAGRPEVKLPDNFRMNFEGWANADPKLQAILDDGKEELRAEHEAIINKDDRSESVDFYNSDDSLKGAREYIKGHIEENETLVGVLRIFGPQVHINNGRGILLYCMDESKGYTKNRKTGEMKGTRPGKNPHLLYRVMLSKNSDGVWVTTRAEAERGEC
ncbi:hypothetical protein ACFYYR_10030 [Streptomyces sp. NPDC001922]|uniref:hypothetical protein n=1 Tax=Streptomyces sp. NPDC001922 TaxID=3364624 RepID=UPI0036BF4722